MGVGIVELLMRCNIVALVGGGVVPKFPKNKVVIWDDYQNHAIAELEFSRDVRGVRLRREVVAVALETEVHVYHFSNLNVITSLYTVANPAGLCALSGLGPVVLACPGAKPGTLHVERVDVAVSAAAAAGSSISLAVTAHQNALTCIALSPDGSLVATASERGTLVRVFDTATGRLVREFRRGTKSVDISSVNFSQDNTLLVADSSSGTAHVFDIASSAAATTAATASSGDLSAAAAAPASSGRERSIVRFHTGAQRALVCFGADKSTVLAISFDGKYSKFSYGVERGQRVCRAEIVDYNLFEAVS